MDERDRAEPEHLRAMRQTIERMDRRSRSRAKVYFWFVVIAALIFVALFLK